MKNIVLAASALTLANLACAQSSVTLYGIVDAAYSFGDGSGPGSASRQQLGSGGNATSRIGFRGTEDLGGGLSAGFWLESQVFTDTGEGQASNANNQPVASSSAARTSQGLTFGRRSTISLIDKTWGELRIGRDFTAHYRNRVEFDPFGNAGVGAAQPFAGSIAGVTSTRASNMVGYFLPALAGGVYGQAQFYRGDDAQNTPTARDGRGHSARLGMKQGAWNVSLAAGRTFYAQTATLGDIRVANVGASYDFGVARLMAGYYRDKVESARPLRARGVLIAALVPVGVGEVKVSVSRYGTDANLDPETAKLSLGYVHNLSKRTALYATYARVKNDGGARVALNGALTAPNHGASGVDLGLRHSF